MPPPFPDVATYSVVITTFNRSHYVRQAVASALSQTIPPSEIIVVDDGSTDATEEALSPYRGRIRYRRQRNQGRAAARNAGLALVSSERVAFLDSDDVWLPEKMERQLGCLERRPGTAMIHGHIEAVDADGRDLLHATNAHRRWYTEVAALSGGLYASWALRCLCFTSTIVLRTEVMRSLGGYDVSFVANEDLDLYLRLALEHRVELLEWPPVTRLRVHTGNTPSYHLALSLAEVCRKHLALLADRPDEPSIRLARRNLHLSIVRASHLLRDAATVRRNVAQAIRLDPAALLIDQTWKRYSAAWLPDSLYRRRRRQQESLD